MGNVRRRNTPLAGGNKRVAVDLNLAPAGVDMPTSVEELAVQAIALSPEDRARLADLLLASLPDAEDAEVDAAWDRELKRRLDSIETGTARLAPAEEVHAEARRIYGR